jgi:starch-binding outer membrane protein, SusD/RagB family
MKTKIYLVATLLCAVFLASCEDIFKLPTDGRLNYEQIFTDNSLTSGYLNKCYSYMPLTGMNYDNNNFLGIYTDEAQDGDDVLNGRSLNYYNGRSTSSSNLIEGGSNNQVYDNMYAGIRKCNVFIDNIDGAQNIVIETDRNKWKGEAYTLRAFYFWYLIKRFGPLPIIKHELPLDFDYSTHTRPSFNECVSAILADCDSALAQPNFPWRNSLENDRGSMNKSVAMAIKSQAILFSASPLWNDGNNYWAKADSITRIALDSLLTKNYALYNPKAASPAIKAYSDYQRLFLLKPEMLDNPANDKETIYAQKNQIGAVWQQNGLPIVTDVVKAGACPSQELVDSYETINGKPVLNPTKPYLDDDHLQPNYNTANTQYNPAKPYENRDPRLFSTIYCNGVFRNLSNNSDPVWTYYGGTCGISTSDRRFTRTGYYLRKFADFTSTKTANKDGYWRYFRLAEIYLNFAEAQFYNKGVTNKAVDALNAVRVRAGLPALPYTISAEEFEQRLRNERRVEFAFEEHRYFDVRRWKIQHLTEGIITGVNIKAVSPGVYSYDRFVVSRRNVTDSKFLMWPIPLTEQLKYKQFNVSYQNPGW